MTGVVNGGQIIRLIMTLPTSRYSLNNCNFLANETLKLPMDEKLGVIRVSKAVLSSLNTVIGHNFHFIYYNFTYGF